MRNLEENMQIVYRIPVLYYLVNSVFQDRQKMNEDDLNNFVNFILSGDEAINTIAEIRYQIKNMESGSISILGDPDL